MERGDPDVGCAPYPVAAAVAATGLFPPECVPFLFDDKHIIPWRTAPGDFSRRSAVSACTARPRTQSASVTASPLTPHPPPTSQEVR